MRQEMRLGTWNVRTMTIDGKIEMVEAELERLRIGSLGLSEVRWTGKGHFLTNDGNLITQAVRRGERQVSG